MNKGHRYTEGYFKAREDSPTFQLELSAFRQALASHRVAGARVLEIGAGSGALARACADEAGVWVASDIDINPLARGLDGRTSARGIVCNALALPVGSASVNAVVAQHVIEHFAEPGAALREWRRVLRPGGLCVLSTPNRRFPKHSWFEDPTHHELFSAEDLRESLVLAGFRSVSVLRLVPWLGSERTVFLSARLQRIVPGALRLSREPSLNLFATGINGDPGKCAHESRTD